MRFAPPTQDAPEATVLPFLLRHAKAIGGQVVEHALKLWFTIKAPGTPQRVKAPLMAALAYLLLPLDAVPDVLPIVGFSDDAAILAGTLALAHLYITDDIVRQAKATRRRIFG